MSGEKSTNPCKKFVPNIFYKSKCQTCFKSREVHLQTDHDDKPAKPIYGGWLCLVPEGTDFHNPIQRSRKWQRRFFILYENGSLSFALDELASTLPQGTVNMNLCTEVIDAQLKTGQRNALCIVTPDQEIFIRGENKDIINGWSEQLSVFPRTNKNQKKKRKVDSTTCQEPSPAKMAATEPILFMENGDTQSSFWQEERPAGGPDVDTLWIVTNTDPPGMKETPAVRDPEYLPTSSGETLTNGGSLPLTKRPCFQSYVADKGTGNSDSQSIEPKHFRCHPPANNNHSTARRHYSEPETRLGEAPGKAWSNEEMDQAGSSRGRSKACSGVREKLQSCGDLGPGQIAATHSQKRAKSLERRTSESVMIPDLLNFKKGWMMKLDEENKWMKYWFVLSADTLRYYQDSLAEENSDLDGEIDLTKCHNVCDYKVQRNYGFQIHTQNCVYTLSAMTAGIRRNWIQALIKNVCPFNAPDVASSLPVHHILSSLPDDLPFPKPDVTQDSSLTSVVPTENVHGPNHVPCETIREGSSKTFGWTELKPMLAAEQAVMQDTIQTPELEFFDPQKRRKREERRRRYESVLGFSLSWKLDCDDRDTSSGAHQKEIEQCWQLVEKSAFGPERTVPLYTECKDKGDIELLLETFNKTVEQLKGQLAESDHRRTELEAQLNSPFGPQPHISHPPEVASSPETDLCSLKTLTDAHMEYRDVLQRQNLMRQSMQEQLQQQLGLSLSSDSLEKHTSSGTRPSPPPSLWVHDTEGNLQTGDDLFQDSSISGNRTSDTDPSSDSGHQNERGNCETGSRKHFKNESRQQTLVSELPALSAAFSSRSLSIEERQAKANGIGIDNLTGCKTPRKTDECADPDQAIALRRMSQEVELLSSQNEALNQRSEEMLNQLTEADREIERLRAELISLYNGPDFNARVEQHCQSKVEGLESELFRREQQLLDAQSLVDSLDQRLRDTEVKLQLAEATLKNLDFPAGVEVKEEDDKDYDDGGEKEEKMISKHHPGGNNGESFHPCLQEMAVRQSELERQLLHREELRETDRLYSERAEEAKDDIIMLSEEVKTDRTLANECGLGCCGEGKWQDEKVLVTGERKIQQVVEEILAMSRTLGRVLQVIDRSDMNVVMALFNKEHLEIRETGIRQARMEEEFWGGLLKGLKANPSLSTEDKLTDVLICQSLEHMVLQNQMLHLAHSKLSHNNVEQWSGGKDLMNSRRSSGDLSIIGNIADETGSEITEVGDESMLNVYNRQSDADDAFRRNFTEITEERMLMLDCIASSVQGSANNDLQSMAQRLYHYHRVSDPWLSFVHRAVMDAFSSYRISRLNALHKKTLQETQQGRLAAPSPLVCSSCAGRLNIEVGYEGGHIDSQTTATRIQQDNTVQQDTWSLNQAQTAGENECGVRTYGEVVEGGSLSSCMGSPVIWVDGWSGGPVEGIRELDCDIDVEDEGKVGLSGNDLEFVLSSLRGQVKDLEERLYVTNESVKAERDGVIASLQLKHNEEVENLKAIYERGFVTIESSHQKILNELQYRHQEELLRLQRETDRLLEEETAATVTAIEAIKSAHRDKLEREIQRTGRTNSNVGDVQLGQICRQHSEELASCNRELEVLCQQYCLKCLECSHLAQALEAERLALGQCQQVNSDLRTRNQELSGHVTSEIASLCSMARQDATPLSQKRNVYELEIALRVKESEVQCLEQEIASLKGQLQTAHRDNQYVSEKFKDVSAELSAVRAKAEFDLGQIRENLKLAHEALVELAPAVDSNNEYQESPRG
ncbi:hypothetical protein DPEC_G00304890 [Dallia pectoralis]|uniref:Uncharacterized protein n=1 Tax=Dallia pectoralis TaxID=75939 RepID=A0ACC2FDP6_DALPE|nr:hypothetical protein DPEC_G00304890 [Dallia pectoralis]